MKIKIGSKKIKRKFIYGNFSVNKKSETVVIFLSGLSGNDAIPLVKSASLEFFEHGFSTMNFNFCNDDIAKNHRTNSPEIGDMSLITYVADLKNVIDTFCRKYSKIVLVGHSFGAIVSILFLSNCKKYTKKIKLVLWDPSILPWRKELLEKIFVFNPAKNLYFEKNTKNPLIINKTFYRELMKTKDTTKVLGSLKNEVCIIGAGSASQNENKRYFAEVKNKRLSTLSIIKGAGHLFGGKRVQKIMFSKTLNFLGAESA
jgi:predicted alpha/beta-fold hydrolase